jgi:hypothetical protein
MVWQRSASQNLIFAHPGACLALLLFFAGCDVPAQMVWSPDGHQAAYRSTQNAVLLGEDGKVVTTLGATIGGFAWSSDSKSLYFAAYRDPNQPVTAIDTRWLEPTKTPATSATTQPAATQPLPQSDDQNHLINICLLHDGKISILFSLLDTGGVYHMELSPNQQWLALVVSDKTENDNPLDLFAYSLKSHRLYEISQQCGFGACFTNRGKLAFAQANGTDDIGKLTGHIVLVTLDDAAATLPRQRLLDVIISQTGWMEACDCGLIFTAAPRTFPGPPSADEPSIAKLYQFNYSDGGLTVLADATGPLFDLSPDGKRLLFEKITPQEPSATCPTITQNSPPPASQPPLRDELCVMNINGSEPHVLASFMDYTGSPNPPMWPAWHGNDQITFLGPADQARHAMIGGEDHKLFDVVLYQITDKGTLKALKTLSTDWTDGLKPYSHVEQGK